MRVGEGEDSLRGPTWQVAGQQVKEGRSGSQQVRQVGQVGQVGGRGLKRGFAPFLFTLKAARVTAATCKR